VFFDSCIETEYLKMSYFLQSGCREQEVAHAELCDLDPKTSTLHVQPKPHRQWKVKDKEDRFIPLPVWLVKRLLELHAGKGPHQLLFPNSGGNVEGHFLRQIQQIALRAGLNCGSCESTVAGKPITCEKNACCSRWSCHAFRRTYATIQH
jgi:integrase